MSQGPVPENEENAKSTRTKSLAAPILLRKEAKQMLSIAGGLCSAYTLDYAARLAGTSMAGHYFGALDLAAFALMINLTDIIFTSVMYGLLEGASGLLGQMSTSGDSRSTGVLVSRIIACNCSIMIPITVIACALSPQILKFTGQDSAVIPIVATLLLIRALSTPFYIAREAVTLWSAIAGYAWISVANGLTVVVVTVVVQWSFVLVGFGVSALAWTVLVAECVSCAVTVFLATRTGDNPFQDIRHVSAWLAGWGSYLSVSVWGIVTLCCDWWVLSLQVLNAGALGINSAAVVGALVSVYTMLFALKIAAVESVGIRVGTAVGAGDAVGVKRALLVGSVFCSGISAVITVGLTIFSDSIARALTSDIEIQNGIKDNMPLMNAYMVVDMMQTFVCVGFLRSMCRLKAPAVISLLTNFTVGLPISYYLVHCTAMKEKGVWVALIIMAGLQFLCFACNACRVDLEREIVAARNRAGSLEQECRTLFLHAHNE